jgi:hypothetical protein
MTKIIKKSMSLFLTLALLFGMFSMVSSQTATAASNQRDIEVVLAADSVSNNLGVTDFSTKLKEALAADGIDSSKVSVKSVDTHTSSAGEFTWNRFDHTNTSSLALNTALNSTVYYSDDGYDLNWASPPGANPFGYALKQDQHIAINGSDITFYGYGAPAFKDFLFTPNSNADNKIFNFTIDESKVAYHSADGNGYLFDASYTNVNSVKTLSGYVVLIGRDNVGIYRLDSINADLFTQENLVSFFTSSYYPSGISSTTGAPFWGGTVTKIASAGKPSSSGFRYLKLVASPTSVSLYQFTDATYSTTQTGGVIFDNVALPHNYGSFGFGPIASYAEHGCSQGTLCTFSNLSLTEDTSVGFADTVKSTNWQYPDSLKVFVNLDNDGVKDFNDTGKLASILYYTMLNNAHYIGWGIDNATSGPYSHVSTQANGFISRNSGKGEFINRSDVSFSSLDNGVAEIARYIKAQLESVPKIDKPTVTTQNSSGNATCTVTNPVTSEGNSIGTYIWKCLNIATGNWETEPGHTSSSNFSVNSGVYSMVAVQIQDSVTLDTSDYTYSYIANVANIAPVAQFSINLKTLMLNSSVPELQTGSIVTATDLSYVPNGSNIAEWEWTVLDKDLMDVPSLKQDYFTHSATTAIDFTGKAAGAYTIRLRTKNANGDWSGYYSLPVTIYDENGTNISVAPQGTNGVITYYLNTLNVSATLTAATGTITKYRLLKIIPGQANNIGDWVTVNAASATVSTNLKDVACTLYIQALDSDGNSKSALLGDYKPLPQINAIVEGTATNYVSGTGVNKNVVMSCSDTGIKYSTDNGVTWAPMPSSITATASNNYKFKYAGNTEAAQYTEIDTLIGKTFSGSISGVTNNLWYTSSVTPIFSDCTATIAKGTGSATALTSDTAISDGGNYAAKFTDDFGNVVTYTFGIDGVTPKLNITGNDGQWTKNDVVLQLDAVVGTSGKSSITVEKNSIVSTVIGTSYNISENGVYKFTLTNGMDETDVNTVDVENIDKVTPAVIIDSVKSGPTGTDNYVGSSTPTANDVTIKLKDGNNNVSPLVYWYKLNNGAWTTMAGDTFSTTEKVIDKDISFKAVSAAGITSDATSPVYVNINKPTYSNDFSIDMKTPGGNTYNGNSWTNQNVTIKVSGGVNPEAFKKYQYSIDNEQTWTDMGGTGNDTITISSDIQTVVSYRVVSKDGGHSSSASTGLKIDKTAPAGMKIQLANNIFEQFINVISFGYFFKENVNVSFSADSGVSPIARYEYKVLAENPDHTYDSQAEWVSGSSTSVSPQFKGIILMRAVDAAGNVSDVIDTNGVVVDSAAPSSTKVTATADSKAYTGAWTSKDISVTASDASALSGINHYEYKTDLSSAWTAMPVSSGAVDSISANAIPDSLIITETADTTYHFRAVSNSGNAGQETTLAVKKDSGVPVVSVTSTNGSEGWTNQTIAFTLANSNTSIKSPVSYWVKVGTNDWKVLSENTYALNLEIAAPVQFKIVTDAGISSEASTVFTAKIDKTAPTISGADSNASYYVGRAISYADNSGSIASATYTVNGGSSTAFSSGDVLTSPGNYVVTVKDAAGNSSSVSYTVNSLPGVSSVLYTTDSKNAIDAISSEFAAHADLPASYSAQIDSGIKVLEDRYAELADGVAKAKQETAGTMANANALAPTFDGLIDILPTVQSEISKFSSRPSVLTQEQQNALVGEVSSLKTILTKIAVLQAQDSAMAAREEAIPKAAEGLMAQQGTIQAVLDDANNLTSEQQTILKPQIDILKGLLLQIAGLKSQDTAITDRLNAIPKAENGLIAQKDAIQKIISDASNLTNEQQTALKNTVGSAASLLTKIAGLASKATQVKAEIDALPAANAVKKTDAAKITQVKGDYDSLNAEQQAIVGSDSAKALSDIMTALDKLMLHDNPTDVTVTGIDGTTFSSDTELVVTPIEASTDAKSLTTATAQFKTAGKANIAIVGKDLVALYDVSMLKDNIKIQPDGKVQVKIKIPSEFLNRTGLEIIHIADDGTVTTMSATSDGKYLIFITDHFSRYGIIANNTCVFGMCKALGIYDADGGVCVDWVIIFAAVLALGAVGFVIYKKKRKSRTA